MRRVKIQVFGRVQRVFFRHSAKKEADALSLKGFVRNEADGSVSIEVEGEEEKLRQFIMWCKRGPMLADVKKCTVKYSKLQHFHVFDIRS